MENMNLELPRLALVLVLMIGEYVLVLLAVAADLWSGVRKARQRGEARRSKALRLTIDKLCRYYNALFALTVIDVMQMAAVEYLRVTYGYPLPLFPLLTLIGAVGIAIIEVRSIHEKAEEKHQAEAEAAVRTLADCLSRLADRGVVDKIVDVIEKEAEKQ